MEVLRIPSVSTDPAHKPDMLAQAEWIQVRLKRTGVPVADVVLTAGHPLVVGRWTVGDDKPTVLIYGITTSSPPIRSNSGKRCRSSQPYETAMSMHAVLRI